MYIQILKFVHTYTSKKYIILEANKPSHVGAATDHEANPVPAVQVIEALAASLKA